MLAIPMFICILGSKQLPIWGMIFITHLILIVSHSARCIAVYGLGFPTLSSWCPAFAPPKSGGESQRNQKAFAVLILRGQFQGLIAVADQGHGAHAILVGCHNFLLEMLRNFMKF